VAQRVGRGIDLLFHDRGTRTGWVVSSTPPPHFTPAKDPVPSLQEAGWAPGPVWTSGKSSPHRDSIPDSSDRSQSLYRLSYPAHEYRIYSRIFTTLLRFRQNWCYKNPPAPIASSLLGPNIFLISPFSGNLSLYCYFSVRDVSQPCNTACKIIFLYLLNSYILLKSNKKDRNFCTAWQQAFPGLNLRLTSFRMQFLYFNVVSTHLRFVSFSKLCYLASNCEIVLNICSLHKTQDPLHITPLQSI